MQHYIIRLTSINLCQPRFLRSLSGLIRAFALILLLGRSSLVFMLHAVGGFPGCGCRMDKVTPGPSPALRAPSPIGWERDGMRVAFPSTFDSRPSTALTPTPEPSPALRASSPIGWERNGVRVAWVLFAALFLCASRCLAAPTNKWELTFDYGESSPAIGSDGTFYLGTFNEKFWAISPGGSILWHFTTGSEVKSSPAIGSDGTLYFGCRDRKFYALTPRGKKKWEFTTGAWVDSSPALGADGTIYFGSWDKKFYALSPDGALKWRFETGGEIESSPAVDADGIIYFGSHDKNFYSLGADGRKRWEYTTGGRIISSPALDGEGGVYFTALDGYLYCLNTDGHLGWRLRTGGIWPSSPCIGPDGTLYVGVNNELWAVSADGKKKWGTELANVPQGSPVAVSAGVYGISRFGLVAVDAEGKDQWRFTLHSYVEPTVTVAADGTTYLAGRYVPFYALDTTTPLARSVWPKFRGNPRNTGNLKDNG